MEITGSGDPEMWMVGRTAWVGGWEGVLWGGMCGVEWDVLSGVEGEGRGGERDL